MTTRLAERTGLLEAEELLRSRELRAALAAFDLAEDSGADPDRCAAGRWQANMLLGRFESAWRESDRIRAGGAPDPNRFWQGEDITGKRVVLRCLHGLGDAVQFLRYVPALQARVSRLIVQVPPSLLQLTSSVEGVREVISWEEHAPAKTPEWDVQLEINELPYLFRTQADDLPLAIRYLHPPPVAASVFPRPADPCSLRVGVVWASGTWNVSRSVPFDIVQPLLSTTQCEFWNLQGGPERESWLSLGALPQLHPADECTHSLSHLAVLISKLDLIITSDTLAAHLAGALGVPAWVMLEHAADWRWQHRRADSPWYPSLCLIRQPQPGDWSSVIEEVCLRLRQCAASRYGLAATLNPCSSISAGPGTRSTPTSST